MQIIYDKYYGESADTSTPSRDGGHQKEKISNLIKISFDCYLCNNLRIIERACSLIDKQADSHHVCTLPGYIQFYFCRHYKQRVFHIIYIISFPSASFHLPINIAVIQLLPMTHCMCSCWHNIRLYKHSQRERDLNVDAN